jgi:hypothetical protein
LILAFKRIFFEEVFDQNLEFKYCFGQEGQKHEKTKNGNEKNLDEVG